MAYTNASVGTSALTASCSLWSLELSAALLLARVEQRDREHERVVDGGAAERSHRVQPVSEAAGWKGPRRQQPRFVVEEQEEGLVLAREQVEHEPIERRPRVRHPAAEHAVADVDEDAQADRQAVTRKDRDLLPHAVLEQGEIVPSEAGDEPAALVGDRRRHLHQFHPRAKHLCRAGAPHSRHNEQDERGERPPSGRGHGHAPSVTRARFPQQVWARNPRRCDRGTQDGPPFPNRGPPCLE
jgi:hypothetical protein